MKIIVVLASRSFIYYVINLYLPRGRANTYNMLTTSPMGSRDPKMCLRNIVIYGQPLTFPLEQYLGQMSVRCRVATLSGPVSQLVTGPTDGSGRDSGESLGGVVVVL